MKKTLSIAIPVYNGEMTIGDTLDSVVCQIQSCVEIVISDNASTDQTRAVVEKYQKIYPEITYFKNSENLGADANIDLVVRHSNGEYVWILGDDDEIVNGGITAVLDVIKKNNDLAAIFVNYGLYDRIGGKCCEERVLKINSDIHCEDSDDFLTAVTIFPNFLSSNIVKRSLWMQVDAKKYIGTHWLQFGILMSIIPGHSAFCISHPYIMNKGVEYNGPNQANKGGVAIGILLNLVDIVILLSEHGYSKESIFKTKNEAYKFLPRKILSSRRNGLRLSSDLFRRLNYHFGGRISYWLRDVPLLLMPQKMHLYIWKLYKIPILNEVFWKMSSKFKWK